MLLDRLGGKPEVRFATVFGGALDMTGAADLTGRAILVVEDDYYVASDTAAALEYAGADVLGPCPGVEAALKLLEDRVPSQAVLDLNLGEGGPRFDAGRATKWARTYPCSISKSGSPKWTSTLTLL